MSSLRGGSESGDVQVYDIAGEQVYETVPRVQGGTAGGDVAWSSDNTRFFYTRHPHEGERLPEDLFFYQQVYFHRLGDSPDADRYELGKDFPRVAEIRVDAHPTRNYVVASVQHGIGGGIEQYLRSAGWDMAAVFADLRSSVQGAVRSQQRSLSRLDQGSQARKGPPNGAVGPTAGPSSDGHCGNPVPIQQGVMTKPTAVNFPVSSNGSLLFVPGTARGVPGAQTTLVWVDRDGTAEPAVDRNGEAMMAVSVESGRTLSLGQPRVLFKGPYLVDFSTSRANPFFDVASDGRFLMVAPPAASTDTIVLVQNWFEELKRLVPTK